MPGLQAPSPFVPFALAAAAAVLAGCAAGDTNHPIGPVQVLDITLQPARIPPHEQGALLLSAATGCYVEFVGKTSTRDVYQFRVGPTQRVPDMDKCLESLRIQPGVTAVGRAN